MLSMDDQLSSDRSAEMLLGVREAVVDSSSVIYMLKAGFLERLAFDVKLWTPPEVIMETGWRHLPLHVRPPSSSSTVETAALTTDERVLALAVEFRLPLVSEDRELLMQAESAGLSYFNALMMLILLLGLGRCDREELTIFWSRLLAVGHYSDRVGTFAEEVASRVLLLTGRS